jgi:hypothetical protein
LLSSHLIYLANKDHNLLLQKITSSAKDSKSSDNKNANSKKRKMEVTESVSEGEFSMARMISLFFNNLYFHLIIIF